MAATAARRARAPPSISLTDRGRIRAILIAVDERWESLHPWDRTRARDLLEQLADCYGFQEVRVSDWG
jgi:hypothetical protein